MWTNWSGGQSCEPAAIERPGSVAEVAAAIERARNAGRQIHAVGSGHSFTGCALTDGTMVDASRLDQIIDVDISSGLVKVQAGIKWHDLNDKLWALGLGFSNLGDIDAQAVAGAVSTSTHGTGINRGNLPSQVEAIELVTADGSVREFSRSDDPDRFHAAVVSIGTFGIVTALTLRCVPAYTLRGADKVEPLGQVLDEMDDRVAANDHFEFYCFPYSDRAITRTNNVVNQEPNPPNRAAQYLEDVVLTNHLFGGIQKVAKRIPKYTPQINRAVMRVASGHVRIDRSYRIFATVRTVRFVEMEYAIPRPAVRDALTRVRDLIERESLPISFPIETRFSAPDDSYLSTAHGRETGYIAVHVHAGREWEPYFRGVEAIMNDYEGRPHWGKQNFQTAEVLSQRYPKFAEFQRVRAELDPEGIFANEYSDRVLGPVI